MPRYSPDPDRTDRGGATREGRDISQKGSSPPGNSSLELMAIIDQAAAGKPTLTKFIERLGERGVGVIASVNARGLNGMSYRFAGAAVRGSDLGRAYTAKGLQDRKGVSYRPERDSAAVKDALEKTRRARPDQENRTVEQPDRSERRRDRYTGLSADQWRTLAEVGTFRTVSAPDLVRHRYAGRYSQWQRDLRVLTAAGLLERRSAVHQNSGKTFDVAVLTSRGRHAIAARARSNGTEQRFYAGLVKPQEIRHDVGIYRMYQREREAIEAAGGTVRRVVMDFEIKRRLMSELNRRGEDPRDIVRKSAIAARQNVHIVEGRFVIPDLRIEYETRDGESARVDLELATADYKAAQLAAKRAAGMKIYSSGVAVGRPDTSSGGTPWEPDYGSALISI